MFGTLIFVYYFTVDVMRALEHKDDEIFQERNEQQQLHSELDFVKHINEGQYRHLRNFRLENETLRDKIGQFKKSEINDLIEQNHDQSKTIDKLAEQNGSLTNAIELEIHISQTKEQIIVEQSQLVEEQKSKFEEQKAKFEEQKAKIEEQKSIIIDQNEKLRKYERDEDSKKRLAEQGMSDRLKCVYK